MEILKSFKKLLENKDKKKIIENTVIVIIIGVIIIVAGSSFFSKKKAPETEPYVKSAADTQTSAAGEYTSSETELKLKSILSSVEGAGKVEVMITYSVSKESIPAYDTKTSENNTDEKDSGGGTRKIAQSSLESSVVFQEGNNGAKIPVLIKENDPVVKGVLVVAEGASEPQVREKLRKAVKALLDVEEHRIEIIERKK